MKHQFIKALGLTIAITGSNLAYAAPFVIDEFADFQSVTDDSTNGNGEYSEVEGVNGYIMGGYRDIWVNKVAPSNNDPLNVSISVIPGTNTLSFSNESQVAGTGMVRWDGSDASKSDELITNTTGLGGLDITDGGANNAFIYDLVSADLDFLFTVTAYTDNDNWTKLTIANPFSSSADAGFPDGIPLFFEKFDASYMLGGDILDTAIVNREFGSSGDVDFGNLGAFEIAFNIAAGQLDDNSNLLWTDIDLTIGRIETNNVPEPTSLALLGLGFLVSVFNFKRQNKA